MPRHVEVFLEQTDALELLTDCDAVARDDSGIWGVLGGGVLVTRPPLRERIAFPE